MKVGKIVKIAAGVAGVIVLAGAAADGWMDEAISFWEKAGDKRKALYK